MKDRFNFLLTVENLSLYWCILSIFTNVLTSLTYARPQLMRRALVCVGANTTSDKALHVS